MNNLVLLLLCFAVGALLRRSGRLPETAPATINALVINVALPAMVLIHLHELPLTRSLMHAAMMPWLLFATGAVFFYAMARLWKLPKETLGALILTGGLANTSFVGVPMIEAFFGRERIGVALVIDQLGSYLILSTLGIFVASLCSGATLDRRKIAAKVLLFPPLWAIAAGLALRGIEYPAWAVPALRRLGDMVAPLALLSVGCQFRLTEVGGQARPLALGLVFKLVLAPFILTAIFAGVLSADRQDQLIALFEAAMPPMIGGAIVAMEQKLNPPLVTLMVGVGIPLSFLTLPVWHYILTRAAP